MLENFVVDHIIHCDYIRSKLAWVLLSEVPPNHLQLRCSCSYYRGEVPGQTVVLQDGNHQALSQSHPEGTQEFLPQLDGAEN